jgi:GNAT superfamily N-acetyltransferase
VTAARLGAILAEAIEGRPPAADGLVVVVGPPRGARAAVVGLTGHHVVAADVDPAWVDRLCPPWAFERPFGPAFVEALAERLGDVRAGTLDLVLHGSPLPDPGLELRPATDAEVRALLEDEPNPRRDHRVWRTPDGSGTLILGRGLEDRWEAAIEVAPEARGRGLGRALATAARALAGGDGVIAQIAPGNVASVRAALAAGFRPLAAEVLFFDR